MNSFRKTIRSLGLALTGLALFTGCYALESPDMEQYRPYARVQKEPIEKGALSVTFLGTSTLLISDGKTTLLTDGFFTRPEDKVQLVFGKIKTDKAKVSRYLKRLKLDSPDSVDAVMVFHSHYDHALDSPEVASKTGAKVLGSSSMAWISKGYGLPSEQIVTIEAHKAYHFGDFTVRFVPSRHIPLPWPADLTGMMESIQKPLVQPASMFDYREGGTYAIVIEHPKGNSMLHGSSYIKDELIGYQVDTIFMCTPGIPALSPQEKDNYYNEVVKRTGAKRIIPIHWDDFSISIDKPLKALPRGIEDFDQFMRFIFDKQKEHPELQLEFLPLWQKTQLFPYLKEQK